ncbi:MAG: hypothetical protein M0R33_11010 [Methylomonas sp.]|jgi:hypothetical protein|uniref:hypothetical protein n=1 Tax=Methylomonas sp. TaxID=418 RepID=UPI0025E1646C|nr:hypothetical protein [Methylomonas sp.]MCK9606961.1 hypothetical protein [Methylomonas sp.]
MFIEIIQDGAGVIEQDQNAVTGFYTGGIQNCLITVYECDSATIMIHDSGQLRLNDICELIRKRGRVNKVTACFGHRIAWNLHQPRLNRILSNIGYRADEIIDERPSSLDSFSFIYPLNGNPTISENEPFDACISIPDKEKRQSVVELNNFFLASNAQSLPLDVQYVNGNYAGPGKLVHSLEEMINTVKSQPQHFFLNLAFLEKANSLEVIELPSELSKIAKENTVNRFIYQSFDKTDLARQEAAFRQCFGD